MKCGSVMRRMSECLDGRLDPARRREIEEHLRSCPRCSEAFQKTQAAEEAARKATAVRPRPGFEEKVLARLDAPPAEGPAPAVARPRPGAFRVVFRTAAGVLIGVLVGVLGQRALQTTERAPAPTGPLDEHELGNPLEKRNVARATRDLGAFLKTSECVATGIHALPWENTVQDAEMSFAFARQLGLPEKLRRAEASRSLLQVSNPRCVPPLQNLIEDQKELLAILSMPTSVSRLQAMRIKVKAQNALDHVESVQRRLPPGTAGFERVYPPGTIEPANIPRDPSKAFQVFTEAVKREIEGDLPGAVSVYKSFPSHFPHSPLKRLAVLREAKAWRMFGCEGEIARLMVRIPKVLEPGELDPFTERQLQQILSWAEGIEPGKKEFIRIIINDWTQPDRLRIHGGFTSVEIDGKKVEMGIRNMGLAYSLFNSLRRSRKIWRRTEEYREGKPLRFVFERKGPSQGDALDGLLRRLVRDAGLAIEPAKVKRLEFRCG